MRSQWRVLTFQQHLRLSHWTFPLSRRRGPTPVGGSAALAENQHVFTGNTCDSRRSDEERLRGKSGSGSEDVFQTQLQKSARGPRNAFHPFIAILTPPPWRHCHAHITRCEIQDQTGLPVLSSLKLVIWKHIELCIRTTSYCWVLCQLNIWRNQTAKIKSL